MSGRLMSKVQTDRPPRRPPARTRWGEGVGGRDADAPGLNDGIAIGKLFVLGFGRVDGLDGGTGRVGLGQWRRLVGTVEEVVATSSA